MTAITLCHFDTKKQLVLQSRACDLAETEYWAVSHIWCEASWCNIPGISQPVLASPQKARFIEQVLPEIVGDVLFWMDILSVDQADEESRRAVVANIPEIYSNANVTLIIREAGGFGGCCDRLLLSVDPARGSYSVSSQVGIVEVTEHVLECHRSGLREDWLDHLWPLQELHLSRTILFATCESRQFIEGEGYWEERSFSRAEKEFNSFLDLAATWAGLDDVDPAVMDLEINHWGGVSQARDQKRALRSSFIRSLLSNDFVSRAELSPDIPSESDPSLISQVSQNSQRKTGKARDFILAVFPRFRWYRTPERGKLVRMEFQGIFEDCARQIRETKDIDEGLRILLRPKITKGMQYGLSIDISSSIEATRDVPTPRTLGEFVNLFCSEPWVHGPEQYDPREFCVPDWQMRQIDLRDGIDFVLEAVATTAVFTSPSHFEEIVQGPHPTGELASITLDHIEESSILHSPKYRIAYIVWYKIKEMRHIMDNPDENLTSLRRTWNGIRELIKSNDSIELRKALLYLSVARALNFSVEAVPSLESQLQPYVLLGRHPVKGKLLYTTLILAAQNLDTSCLKRISAYEPESYPYVTALRPADADHPGRAIGLTPSAGLLSSNILVQLDRGFPEIYWNNTEYEVGAILIKDTYF